MKPFCGNWLIILLAALPQPAIGSDLIDLGSYVEPTKESIRQIRQQWNPLLSAPQSTIERSISYSVPLTWNSNGLATLNCSTGKDRAIYITAGQAFVLAQITDAYMRTITGQMTKECFEDYLQHISSAFEGNSRLPGSTPLFTPASYALRNRHICKPIVSAPMSNEKWEQLFDSFMRDSLNLLLAHELGHHIYDHGCRKRTNSEIRQEESRADDFAVQLMIKNDPKSVLGAIPLLTFWSLNSPTSSVEETGNTHPAGLRRLRSALDAVERNLDGNPDNDFYRYLRKSNQLGEFRKLLSELRESTKELK